MKMADKPSEAIRDIMPAVLKGLGLDKKMEEAGLLESWPEIVGKAISRRSRPRRVANGLLLVEVENNVWMQEIRFHQKEIVGRINEKFPKIRLRGIHLEIRRERDGE